MARPRCTLRYGLADITRHVIDMHLEPSLIEFNGML